MLFEFAFLFRLLWIQAVSYLIRFFVIYVFPYTKTKFRASVSVWTYNCKKCIYFSACEIIQWDVCPHTREHTAIISSQRENHCIFIQLLFQMISTDAIRLFTQFSSLLHTIFLYVFFFFGLFLVNFSLSNIKLSEQVLSGCRRSCTSTESFYLLPGEFGMTSWKRPLFGSPLSATFL